MPRRIAFSSPQERAASAIVTAGVVGLVGWALVIGLTVHGRAVVADALESFAVAPLAPPPPRLPPPPPPRPAEHRPKDAAAPPNLRSTPTEIVAPKPVLTPPPQPVVAAPIASTGSASSAGAADVAGAGTGAGGDGNGLGGGGDGGGTAAYLISRDLRLGDLPHDLLAMPFSGTVYFDMTVGTDGRVHGCVIRRSIGISAVDAATCRAAIERLRFSPERDRSGRKIPVVFRSEQRWDNERREEFDDDRDR